MSDEYKSTRLGDLLVEQGAITRQQLAQAIELQQLRRRHAIKINAPNSYKQELGELLIELGFIARNQLKSSLSWQKRLRKTTAMMVFVAPLLTAACGGGSGGGSGTNNSQTLAQPSPSLSSDSFAEPESSSASSIQISSSLPLIPISSSASSIALLSSASPMGSSVPFSSSAASIPLPSEASGSSLPSMPVSSSSFSSARSSSLPAHSSSMSSSAGLVNGPVQIFWTAPTYRENGAPLDITEIGGYDIRYKRKSDSTYTHVVINDGYVDAYYFDYLNGDYEFQMAAFDVQGVYSKFAQITAQ